MRTSKYDELTKKLISVYWNKEEGISPMDLKLIVAVQKNADKNCKKIIEKKLVLNINLFKN